MDLIGGVASISQLLHTGCSVTKSLIKLYKAIQSGPAEFQEHKFNIRLLLIITEKICKRTSSKDESIVLLFAQVTDSVHKIINLLEQKGIFGFNWVSFTKGETIAAAFESLNRKRDLLQLHMSHESLGLLHQIQRDMPPKSKRGSKKEKDIPEVTTSNLIVYENKRRESSEQASGSSNGQGELTSHGNQSEEQAIQEIAQGWGAPSIVRVTENKVTGGATQRIGNTK